MGFVRKRVFSVWKNQHLEVESSLKGMLESEGMDINMLKNAKKKTIIFVEKFT